MSTAVWTVFAVGVMVAMFAGCVIVVAAGVRALEHALAKRRERRAS
jgi:hypothetical protein